MAEGLQVYNDSGIFQIDGSTPNLCFISKGTLTTGGSNPNYSTATVTVATGQIIAFSSTTPTAMVRKEGTTVTLSAGGAAPKTINYWIFGASTAVSTFGLQVFNSSGTLVYDSGRSPIRVKAIHTGIGSSSHTSGRTYAAIPMQVYVKQERFVVYTPPGVPTTANLFNTVTVDSVSISSATVTTQAKIVADAATTTSIGTEPSNWTYSSNNGATTQYLIVDVTNY